MQSAREDYLLRMMQQVNASLRRLRERLMGGDGDDAELAAIAREAAEAIVTLLGPQAPLLQHIDATSAVALVAAADRVEAWVGLLDVQATATERRGDARH